LISALDGGEWSASHSGRFISGETTPGTYWIGGWVGPRVGLDRVPEEKSELTIAHNTKHLHVNADTGNPQVANRSCCRNSFL